MFMCSVLVWHVSGRLALCLFYIKPLNHVIMMYDFRLFCYRLKSESSLWISQQQHHHHHHHHHHGLVSTYK